MPRAAPPPLHRTLRELLNLPRVLLNPVRRPLRGEAFGRGRPLLVIPGLGTGDVSTVLLRRTLAARGFRPEGWGLGLNRGADPRRLALLEARIRHLHAQSGERIVLMGWSLGGLYARVLAHRAPEALAMVVTVASPFSGDRHANRAWRFYNLVNDHTVDDPPFAEDLSAKPPVPTIAVWSGVDGIVAGECTRGEADEADCRIRVDAPHFALGTSRRCIERVIAAVAEGDRLARERSRRG